MRRHSFFWGKSLSYRSLIAQADLIADILASSGVKKGEMILSCINVLVYMLYMVFNIQNQNYSFHLIR